MIASAKKSPSYLTCIEDNEKRQGYLYCRKFGYGTFKREQKKIYPLSIQVFQNFCQLSTAEVICLKYLSNQV